MKRIIILSCFLLAMIFNSYSQMPANGDFSNWDWENNDQENWKRKDGNTWREINPAFRSYTDKAGLMVEIYRLNDFTKAKGWKLIYGFRR